MNRVVILLLSALLGLLTTGRPESSSLQQDADYSMESRAAMGAHHICSGL